MEIEAEQAKVTETLQQSSSASVREKEELTEKVKSLEQENLSLLDQFQDIESTKSAEIAELKINLDSLQKNLEEIRENSSKLSDEKAKLEKEYENVLNSKSSVEDSYQQTLVSLNKLKIVETEKQTLEHENEAQKASNETLSNEIVELKGILESLQHNLNEMTETSTKLGAEKAQLEHDCQEILNSKASVEDSYQQTLASLEALKIVEKEKEELEVQHATQKAELETLQQQFEQAGADYAALEIRLNENVESSSTEIEGLKHQMQENEEKFQVSMLHHHRRLIHLIVFASHHIALHGSSYPFVCLHKLNPLSNF